MAGGSIGLYDLSAEAPRQLPVPRVAAEFA